METKPIEDLLAENWEAMKPVDKAIEGHMLEQEDLQDVTEQAVHDLLHVAPRGELRDEQVPLTDLTLQIGVARLKRYDMRLILHETLAEQAMDTKEAIEALLADGYPEEPMPEVDHEVTDDLDQNRDTIEYARSRFKVRQLTTKGTFEAGEQHAP